LIMKKWKTLLTGMVIAAGVSGLAFAAATATQTVTMQIGAIAALAIVGGNPTLAVVAPAQGGAPPANPTSNANYAQYTSTVPSATTRRLQANWGGADAAPAGCSLLLTAAPAGGQGTTAGQITMSATAQNIVTGIGSCATGITGTSGAQLTYVLSINSLTSLVAADNHTVTITITLTDN
jgi:hypothetical protein